jgi:O-antigen/teichoic acid export membrane protein
LLWSLLAWFGVEGAALAVLAGNLAAMVLAGIWMRRLLPGVLPEVRRRFTAALLAAVAAAVAATLFAGPWTGFPALIAGAAAGVAATIAVLWLLNTQLGLELREFGTLLHRESR